MPSSGGLSSLEHTLLSSSKVPFIGVDEAGRGPLAGPVVASAVMWNYSVDFKEINDSKALSPPRRIKMFEYILQYAEEVEIGIVSPSIIDNVNIRHASLLAMRIAVSKLSRSPKVVLIDGRDSIPGLDLEQMPVVGGDSTVKVISAASVIAKVVRDALMADYDSIFPGYQFQKHKGYPTSAHKKFINEYGVSPIHRKTYNGVKHLV